MTDSKTDQMSAKYEVVITASIVWLVFESGMKPKSASKFDLILICACDSKWVYRGCWHTKHLSLNMSKNVQFSRAKHYLDCFVTNFFTWKIKSKINCNTLQQHWGNNLFIEQWHVMLEVMCQSLVLPVWNIYERLVNFQILVN